MLCGMCAMCDMRQVALPLKLVYTDFRTPAAVAGKGGGRVDVVASALLPLLLLTLRLRQRRWVKRRCKCRGKAACHWR
jgi:hypothetical protein